MRFQRNTEIISKNRDFLSASCSLHHARCFPQNENVCRSVWLIRIYTKWKSMCSWPAPCCSNARMRFNISIEFYWIISTIFVVCQIKWPFSDSSTAHGWPTSIRSCINWCVTTFKSFTCIKHSTGQKNVHFELGQTSYLLATRSFGGSILSKSVEFRTNAACRPACCAHSIWLNI